MIEQIQTYHFALLSLPKIHTDLLWVLTIAFCSLGGIYFIFVFFFRNKLSKRAARVAEKKRELAPVISHFLFHEKDAPAAETKEYLNQKVEIREMIKTGFNRSVLAEILTDLQKDVSGEARQNLYDLYVGLGLHHDAYKKLKSWRWEVVSQGILELTQMNVEDSYVFIRRFINHSKGVIRKQAQIATVSLRHEGISYFMDTCRYRISEWQQLKLIDVLRHFEDFTPPRFKVWLTSKNNDIVLFALRLIRYYSQNDANQAIIQLIKHKDLQIRSEAIQCLKEFGVTESLETLKASFRRSNTEIKLSILDAIGALGSKADVEFLKKVERTEDNFTVKSKALTAINTIDPNLIMPNDNIREPSKSDLAFARTDAEAGEDSSQTKLDFELMKPENDETQEEIQVPEVFEDDPDIFDLCCQEEFDDILEEAALEEEPDYLALDFLPLVKDDYTEPIEAPVSSEEKDHIEENTLTEEEKFREDLDLILNKIAMKNDQNHKENHEDLPEFLPRVVASGNETETDQESDEFLEEMEVISEMIYGEEELFEADTVQEEKPEVQFADKLLETEVIAEELESPKDEEDVIEIIEESDDNDQTAEDGSEYDGFSIFHEMFRDFDNESKLILLDELLVVGEEKELHLLRSLSTDPDRRIRKKAAKIRKQLEEKLSKPQTEEEQSLQETDNSQVVLTGDSDTLEELVPVLTEVEIAEDVGEDKASRKLPLEYCFYQSEDLDLESLEPQFDINEESQESPENKMTEDIHGNEVSDEKFISFIENLLSLKLKQRPNKNG